MRTRSWTTIIATVVVLVGSLLVSPSAAAATSGPKPQRPDVIRLPDGFQPEGISIGGDKFFVGSRVDGAIYRGSLRTGEGKILVPGVTGLAAIGTEVDDRHRLWVAGGATGAGRVYDTRTGELLASFQFAEPGNTFVNDVVVTDKAAYFTDSRQKQLYVVSLDKRGRTIGEQSTLPLTDPLQVTPGATNLNGIEASPDGRTLIVVQTNTGFLFTVNPKTGVTTRLDIGTATVVNGDGLLRLGRTLYVVQNRSNLIQPIKLSRDYSSGTLLDAITNEEFDIPATVGYWKGSLYAVNARFGTSGPEPAQYTVVRTRLP